jgi:hypothetical protein
VSFSGIVVFNFDSLMNSKNIFKKESEYIFLAILPYVLLFLSAIFHALIVTLNKRYLIEDGYFRKLISFGRQK